MLTSTAGVRTPCNSSPAFCTPPFSTSCTGGCRVARTSNKPVMRDRPRAVTLAQVSSCSEPRPLTGRCRRSPSKVLYRVDRSSPAWLKDGDKQPTDRDRTYALHTLRPAGGHEEPMTDKTLLHAGMKAFLEWRQTDLCVCDRCCGKAYIPRVQSDEAECRCLSMACMQMLCTSRRA